MLRKNTIMSTIYDEYTILAQINQGGNGTVFRVSNSNGQLFALKAIDRKNTSRDKLKRFRNELAFCENDNHKNIIKIIDHGTYEKDDINVIFYVMPFCPMTLREKVKGGIKHEEVLPLFYQLLDALKFAHHKKIWHRDIKPENILLDNQGNLLLADFGIAHFCAEEIITAIETRKGDRLANFIYAAPEQRAKDSLVDGRADVYAAGLILNELFTGKVIAGARYSTIGSVASSFSFLDDIVSSMICQNPADRLFPIEKIAVSIAAAQTSEHNRQELIKLAAKPEIESSDYQEIPVPTVVGVDYKENTLFLHLDGLDYYNFQVWFETLKKGNYTHSSVLGYDPSQLRLRGNTISISVRSENPQTVNSIARHIKEWLTSATAIFNRNQRQDLERKRMEEERKIEVEIQHRKAEEEIRKALNLTF